MASIQTAGGYGMYNADPELVSDLAEQYFGNVNSSYRVILLITEGTLGHPIFNQPTVMELLIMLASTDGGLMSSSELRDLLATTEV